MKQNILKYAAVLSIAGLLVSAVSVVTGKHIEIDQNKMNTDLKIMSKVLSTELGEGSNSDYFRYSRIRGSYLDGYGAIFNVPLTTKIFKGRDAVTASEKYSGVLDNFTNILAEYGDIISQAEPSDLFTIISTSKKPGIYGYDGGLSDVVVYSRKAKYEPVPFVLSVKFSDISRLVNNRISKERFKERINFEEYGTEDSIYLPPSKKKRLAVLKGIMEVALEEKLNINISSESVFGAYLKDFGVLLRVSASGSRMISINSDEIVIEDEMKKGSGQKVDLAEFENSLAKVNYELNKYDIPLNFYVDHEKLREVNEQGVAKAIDSISEILADYGSRFKELDPSEKIAVQFSTRDYRYGPGLNTQLLHVSDYSDLLDYKNGKINIQQFKNKVKVYRLSE